MNNLEKINKKTGKEVKRTIENCMVIKKATMNDITGAPGTESHQGRIYCQGYEGADGDPYRECQYCDVSIYSQEGTE